ncbi:MAG: hypothetical protein Q9174_002958 [Haloplaca sp. 1 TL-2023]
MNDDQEALASVKSSSDPDWWSTLGLDFEKAFGNDPIIIAAVQKWLSYLPPKSHVLDIGCGTGVPVARTIADAGYLYHGIDYAAGMLDLCRAQVPEAESLEVVDMLSYKPSRTFDGVVASLSFFELKSEEHVDMVGRWASWLRDGGVFLVCTITADESRDGYGDQSKGTWDQERGCVKDMPTPFMGKELLCTFFTQRGWVQLLEGAGLEILSTVTDFYKPKQGESEPRYYVVARKPARS